MKGEKHLAQHNPFRGLWLSLWLPWSAWCSSAEAQCLACSPFFLSKRGFSTALSDLSLQTRPARTHNVEQCPIISAATNLIRINPQHKWRNWEISHALVITALIRLNVGCWLYMIHETVKTKSLEMGDRCTSQWHLFWSCVKYLNHWKPGKNPTASILYKFTSFSYHMPTAFLFSGLKVSEDTHRSFVVAGAMNGIFPYLVFRYTSVWSLEISTSLCGKI